MEISKEEYVKAMNEFKHFSEYEYFEDSKAVGLVNTNKIGVERDWNNSLERKDYKRAPSDNVKYAAFGEPLEWIKNNLRKALQSIKDQLALLKCTSLMKSLIN